MDLHKCFDLKEQEAMRRKMQEIAVKEKLSLNEMALLSGVRVDTLRRFLFKGDKAGTNTILGIAHILDKYNDRYE